MFQFVFEKLSKAQALGGGQVVEVVSFRSNNEPLFISRVPDNVCWVEQHLCSIWSFVVAWWVVTATLGERCDVQDGDLVELSAANASNPDKAKSANSVSLILVYICLPVPAPPPLSPHHDRAWWRRNHINSSTPQLLPLAHPHLAFTDPISTRASQRKPQSPQLSSGLTPRHPAAPSSRSAPPQ